jgi:hypothetical protein
VLHPDWPSIDDFVVHVACLLILMAALARFVRDEIRKFVGESRSSVLTPKPSLPEVMDKQIKRRQGKKSENRGRNQATRHHNR